jgi:hypothetical protein
MDDKLLLQMIQDVTDSLYRSELIPNQMIISDQTVLLGIGSSIDSIAFITLFSEMEDRLSSFLGKEVFIDFNRLHDFNPEKSNLSVAIMIAFIKDTFFGRADIG